MIHLSRPVGSPAASQACLSAADPGWRRCGGERGFALLIVLWTMVLTTLLVIQISAAGRMESRIAVNLRSGAMAEAAADGAVHETLFRLLDGTTRNLLADGAVRHLAIPNGAVALRVRNEAGKINPNTASPALLASVLRAVGADPAAAAQLATNIVAWRTPDLAGQVIGASVAQYRAAGRAYAPPGAPFQTLDEFGLVLGMTSALLSRLTPHLSLYNEEDIVSSAADPVVLSAIQQLLGAGAQSTGADAPIAAAGDVSLVSVVSITAEARLAGGGDFVRNAVVRIAPTPRGRPFQILLWEDAAP